MVMLQWPISTPSLENHSTKYMQSLAFPSHAMIPGNIQTALILKCHYTASAKGKSIGPLSNMHAPREVAVRYRVPDRQISKLDASYNG